MNSLNSLHCLMPCDFESALFITKLRLYDSIHLYDRSPVCFKVKKAKETPFSLSKKKATNFHKREVS